MPAPLIVGLGVALSGFFGAVIGKLIELATSKVIAFTLFLVAALALTSILTSAIISLFDSLPGMSFNDAVSSAGGSGAAQFAIEFLPSNTLFCINAVIAAEAASMAARWWLRIALVKAQSH